MRSSALALCIRAAAGCSCDPSWCQPLATPAAEQEIFAFVTKDSWKSFLQFQPRVTTIALFGSVTDELICAAHQRGVRVVTGQDFDKSKLGEASARAAWVQKLVEQMTATGLDGYNIDIEGNPGNRDELTALITELSIAVRKANPHAQLSFDLGILPKGQMGGYAHADLAKELDFIVPMAYDECWGAKAAAANSPIENLDKGVQQYADLGVPASKLVLGFPWYGWDFPCDSTTGWDACDITIPSGKDWYGYATQISFTSANATATQAGETRYDDATMTAFTEYKDSDGVRHQQWFDDVKTLSSKYARAAQLGVKGVAFWTADEVDYSSSEGRSMWAALGKFGTSSGVVV